MINALLVFPCNDLLCTYSRAIYMSFSKHLLSHPLRCGPVPSLHFLRIPSPPSIIFAFWPSFCSLSSLAILATFLFAFGYHEMVKIDLRLF